MLQIPYDGKICVGDLLCDLRGFRFRVKEFALIRWLGVCDDGRIPLGVIFEFVDRKEVYGRILLSEPYEVGFLFCGHSSDAECVDADYADEYRFASRTHACAVFRYEDLLNGRLTLCRKQITGLAVYRGRALSPEQYGLFYTLLKRRNILLINTPEEYEACRVLPNWYEGFREFTLKSWWVPTNNTNDAVQLSEGRSGPFVVCDYAESRMHEWYEACYIREIADRRNAARVIENFVRRQADALTGGIVLRQLVPLRQIGFHAQSGMPLAQAYSVFVLAGEILAVGDYWTDAHGTDLTACDFQWIREVAQEITCSFAAMDLVREANGGLIMAKLADGQVSALRGVDAAKFYQTLAACAERRL